MVVRLTAEVRLVRGSCPGVSFRCRDPLILSLSLLGTSARTHTAKPCFPLTFNQR